MEIGKWIGEAIAATLVGSAATWLTATKGLRAAVDRLEQRVEALEAEVDELRDGRADEQAQSAADHANAANLAQRVTEVKALSEKTHETMQRILGLLQGKGIGGNFS